MDKFWVIVEEVNINNIEFDAEYSVASRPYSTRDEAEQALLDLQMRDSKIDYYLMEAVACVSFPTETRPTYVVEEI